MSLVATAELPTEHGDFTIHVFESRLDGATHVALVKGDLGDGQQVLARVHSSCVTGDIFHSSRCDCGQQLDMALARVAAEGRGVVLLGVTSLRLMSNNPRKLAGVTGDALVITERVPLEVEPSDANRRYLKTKKDKLGHQLTSV